MDYSLSGDGSGDGGGGGVGGGESEIPVGNPFKQEKDMNVKVVLLGAPGVGKTAIVSVSVHD